MSAGRRLIDITKEFATESQCHDYLEKMRWPEGVLCVECGSNWVAKFIAKGRERINKKGEIVRSPDRYLYQCRECKHQFTTTVGTIFNDSHLPLRKWFIAVALMINAKKGLSAKQLQRDLGISYRTAWYAAHRIRKAMEDPGTIFTGVCEVDETYVGGRYDKRRNRKPGEKQGVVGALQRKSDTQCSQVHAQKIEGTSKLTLTSYVRAKVAINAEILYTDEATVYRSLKKSTSTTWFIMANSNTFTVRSTRMESNRSGVCSSAAWSASTTR
jgi:transposase-like protein